MRIFRRAPFSAERVGQVVGKGASGRVCRPSRCEQGAIGHPTTSNTARTSDPVARAPSTLSEARSAPPTLKYEPGLIVAEGNSVIIHGRFSGHGRPKNWIAADIVRVVDGILVEHWDVLQDEASRAESKSGLPMFGPDFSA